ncbi:hypothetical protein FHY55_09620 [Oceanicola sp. D3]|uniref:hypothetical protein n=1 Tax=Oceanicola sp. D3 TaxID=2587163 RepID=UPI00111D9199|nr:hypothetical protein [Oceanicola sp. D3]QDC09489.1 hypothetical protein FHY55_09620 [Oceanicola sp. D3]
MTRISLTLPTLLALSAPAMAGDVLIQRCNAHVGGGKYVSGLWVTTAQGRSYHPSGAAGLSENATYSRDKALTWLATQMPINPARTVYSSGCNPKVDHPTRAEPAPAEVVAAVEVEEPVEVTVEESENIRAE